MTQTDLVTACEKNDFKKVKEAIADKKIDINKKFRNVLFPIEYAIEKGNSGIVQLLLDNGAITKHWMYDNALRAGEIGIYRMMQAKFPATSLILLRTAIDFQLWQTAGELVDIVEADGKHLSSTDLVTTLIKKLPQIPLSLFEIMWAKIDDASIQENKLAMRLVPREYMGTLIDTPTKLKDDKISHIILNDKKVIATAIKLKQTELIPEQLKKIFLVTKKS